MTYRLIVLDLDGTVMSPELVISPAVVEAIRAARDAGVIVTIATGRVYRSAVQFLDAIGIDGPIICYQGAVVRDPVSGDVLYQAGLDGGVAGDAVRMLHEEDIFVTAFRDERTWVTRSSKELDLYLSFHPGGEADVSRTPDLERFVRERSPIKLLFSTPPDQLDEVVSRYAAAFEGRASVIRSHRSFGEITAPGVHKGSAIAALAARLGIGRDQVIAIGDEENDTPMIEWAGLGLAMGNAPESVRARADAVIPSIVDDGVAWAIRHYLLEPAVR